MNPADVRIVSGTPDDDEVAAVCAVLAAVLAAARGERTAPPRRPATWLRGDVHVAPGAWTAPS